VSTPPPDSLPWYRSRIIVGILTAVVVQVAARIQSQYHIDFKLYGVTADQAVAMILDGFSAIAASVALHARATQRGAPTITMTKVTPPDPTRPAPPA